MRIYLATWLLERNQGEVLTRVGYRRRLLSYYFLQDKEEELPPYVRTGRNPADADLSGGDGTE